MSRIAVATTSQRAADAAREIADAGGNAVDCALAAALVTINTEPSVCALAGSAFITIWPADGDPVTIDGNVAVPGSDLSASQRGRGAVEVEINYGGGITTLVGAGAVAIPGTLAAIEYASEKYGSVPWRTLFEPTIRDCRNGFALPAACRYYLGFSSDRIFNRSKDGFDVLHHADGTLLDAGERVILADLANSLEAIANDGAAVFYRGEIAAAIVDHCRRGDGALTAADMANYRAVERAPLLVDIGDWRIASNPPPAVGGTVLAAMLLACADLPTAGWTGAALEQLIATQRACLDFRRRHLDLADDIGAASKRLLERVRNGQLLSRWTSSSTVQTSVVDDSGGGCSITASSGYGSGEMPAGTGLWLNNCLGEIELNRRGLDAGPIGARLPSNMAPSVGRGPDGVLAVGSPGADRITTALQQFLLNYLQFKMPLRDAIAHPRLHVDTSGEEVRLMAEPGHDLPDLDLPLHQFTELVMYFGGVSAAVFDRATGFDAAADPRREGGVFVSNR